MQLTLYSFYLTALFSLFFSSSVLASPVDRSNFGVGNAGQYAFIKAPRI